MLLTLVGIRLVQVAEVAINWSSPYEVYCGIVSIDTHSIIDEVESAALCVICDLKTRLDESVVRSAVGGHHSQSIDSRNQARELHMTTRT